jgi:hypothetical protein
MGYASVSTYSKPRRDGDVDFGGMAGVGFLAYAGARKNAAAGAAS